MDQNVKVQLPTQEEVSERIEHRDALLNLRAVLKTNEGRGFFKFLFKNYSPIDLPPEGVEGTFLHEKLGMKRAFNELWNLACEADHMTSALILAEVRKENYERVNRENSSQQGG